MALKKNIAETKTRYNTGVSTEIITVSMFTDQDTILYLCYNKKNNLKLAQHLGDMVIKPDLKIISSEFHPY